jgi:plastocyanin
LRLTTNASVQRVCGPEVEDNGLRVDANGGVAEVVVWTDAPAEPPPVPAPQAVLDQRGCLYAPAVLAARAGGTLRLRNSDPLTHTVHAVNQGRSLFNVAMPLEHMELLQKLPAEAAVLEVRCDVHPWMRASVRTFEHPHFTTTGTDGHFELAGLLRGDVELHAWHPKLGEASQRVQLREGVAYTDFDFGGAP